MNRCILRCGLNDGMESNCQMCRLREFQMLVANTHFIEVFRQEIRQVSLGLVEEVLQVWRRFF